MTRSMTQALLFHSFLTFCVLCSAALADEDRLTLPAHADDAVQLMLENPLGRDPAEVLQVFVGDAAACCVGKTPVTGLYRVERDRLTFDPIFDFIEGQTYTVSTRGIGPSAEVSLFAFNLEADMQIIPPEVIAIYPSGTDIPENTLRFYIVFSTPMKPHVSMDYISLVDANGTPDDAAFMTFKKELWNQDRTRLTLLMDPGRIKRGVATNVDLGPALIAGNQYAIRIEDGWQSVHGGQDAPSFEHVFTASDALRNLPDTALWQFETPRISTRDPLLITFDRPFDRQMSHSAITVLDAGGQVVSGLVSIEDAEQTWRFAPHDVWTTQSLSIVADATFEDVAGNNLRELLDHSVGIEPRAIDQQTVTLALKAAPT